MARSEKQSPIFIIESGDNPGAGASQDISTTLEYLLSLGLEERILYAVITEKKAYQTLRNTTLNYNQARIK